MYLGVPGYVGDECVSCRYGKPFLELSLERVFKSRYGFKSSQVINQICYVGEYWVVKLFEINGIKFDL
jgi:hypothetical protein